MRDRLLARFELPRDWRFEVDDHRGARPVGAARLGILDFVEDAVDSAVTSFIPVKTRALLPPRDDLWDALDPVLPPLQEGDVVAITSKVVAIHQGRCVPADAVADKEELVAAEADRWLPKASSKYGITLAIKGCTLIASAGIDASNARDHYVLWPDDPWGAAREIALRLRARHGLSRLGVILTDSHLVPLRRGTTGISIGSDGFDPLRDYRGRPDIFGRPLEVTLSNQADAIAAACVGLMGEGAECIPAVVVRNWPGLHYSHASHKDAFLIPPEEDFFAPLLAAFDQRA
jgi:F420-0:gamma-glutamyl ligase